MDLVKIFTWMGIIGIPSIFSITMLCVRICHKYTKQMKILMKSQQAQMRSNLLERYHKYMEQGWITEEALADWENCYQSYHELGQNGILDCRRADLMKLQTRK